MVVDAAEEPLPASLAIRKRHCGPKVRTGCVTCKIRHVKCDEAKPFCRRCTSTQRNCDGYQDATVAKPRRRRKKLDLVDTSPALLDGSSCSSGSPEPFRDMFGFMGGPPDEARAIEYFCHRAAHRISSFVEPTYWLRVLAQLGSDQSIRKSIIACSAVYEKAESGSRAEDYANDRKILLFYNNAIRSLMSPEGVPTHIALISCVLFICLEFLRGNIQGSIIHSRAGLKLIEDMREEFKRGNGTGSVLPGADIIDELEPIFSRLSLQSTLFGKFASQESMSSPEDAYIPAAELFEGMRHVRNGGWDRDESSALEFDEAEDSEDAFASVEQAKIELFLFLHDAHGFGVKTFAGKYRMEITMDQVVEHMETTAKFKKWRAAFGRYLEHNRHKLSRAELTAAKVLQVYSRSSFVWVATCLEPSETAYDQYKTEFEEIVNFSEEIVKDYFSGEPQDSSRIFVSNLSIIPPLHLTAWKCRWPEVRRKAIRILSSRHWREGLFDSHRSAKCFERVAEIEESAIDGIPALAAPFNVDLEAYPTPPHSDRASSIEVTAPPTFGLAMPTENAAPSSASPTMPPEWARIHHVEFDFEHCNANRQKVVFYSKPYGPYGDWYRREESIFLMGDVELGASSML